MLYSNADLALFFGIYKQFPFIVHTSSTLVGVARRTLLRAGYKMEDYDAIFRGDYSCLPQEQSSVVRIFLSSTFGGNNYNIIIEQRYTRYAL